jgi:hypothetical protein
LRNGSQRRKAKDWSTPDSGALRNALQRSSSSISKVSRALICRPFARQLRSRQLERSSCWGKWSGCQTRDSAFDGRFEIKQLNVKKHTIR